MHVQSKSWKMAEEESCHDQDQYNGHMFLFVSSDVSPSSDCQVDFSVQKRNCKEGKDSEEQKAKPIVVIGNVEMVGSKVCHIHKQLSSLSLRNFTLKKLWNVHNKGDKCNWKEISEEASSMRGGVSENLMIVKREIDSNITLGCKSHRHKDRASQSY